jgi:hypothetical protein
MESKGECENSDTITVWIASGDQKMLSRLTSVSMIGIDVRAGVSATSSLRSGRLLCRTFLGWSLSGLRNMHDCSSVKSVDGGV